MIEQGLGNNRTGIGKLNNREISGGGAGNDIEVLLESLLSFPKKKQQQQQKKKL